MTYNMGWLLVEDKELLLVFKGQIVFGKNSANDQQEILPVNEIPFVIPRRLVDFRRETPSNTVVGRAKMIIRRMDEYLLSPEDQDQAKRQRREDTSLGLRALAAAAESIQKVSFREVLTVGETLQDVTRRISLGDHSAQLEKIDPITDFQEEHDLIEFEEALIHHREKLLQTEPSKPSDMLYLKFCLLLELQRDEYESCLRILLHEIIFKFHLSDFRLRCEIHIRKPMEDELVIEKIVHDSHLKTNYSAQFIILSGDWIAEQDVELYIVMKIESLSINKYIGSKFWDMTHLHIKNIPHGSSRIFLRELTPVSRPYKIVGEEPFFSRIDDEGLFSFHGELMWDKRRLKRPIDQANDNYRYLLSKLVILKQNDYYEHRVGKDFLG